jgi:anti-anti-sigma factor
VPSVSVPPAPAEQKSTFTTQHWLRIWVSHHFTAASINRQAAFWRDAMHYRRHCVLDLSSVRAFDSTGAALLVQWRKQLQGAGRELILLYPSLRVRRVRRELKLDDFFLIAEGLAQAQQQVAESMGYGPSTVLNEGAGQPLIWQGEITAANAEGAWLVTALHLITRGKAASPVPIDLSRLRFLDSSGAGLMLRVAQLGRQFDTDVRFTGAQPNVRNVLRLTQTDRLLAPGAPS